MFEPDSTSVAGPIDVHLPDGSMTEGLLVLKDGHISVAFEDGVLADTLLTLAVNGHLQSIVLGYDMTVAKA